MPPRTNRWKALRRVASPGKRSSAPQYVAVRIAQAAMPERKLRTGDFLNRQVGTSVNSANATARARLRSDANRSRYETRFAATSHVRPTPEKPIPRRTPRRNAWLRTHPLRTGEAGIGSSLRILAVAPVPSDRKSQCAFTINRRNLWLPRCLRLRQPLELQSCPRSSSMKHAALRNAYRSAEVRL
jgi:hypothetical protein